MEEFLYYLNKITHRRIYHYIIGSELLEMVAKNPKFVKYLNALDANWFEYDSGTRYLESQGVTNVTTLPNFKVIQPVENAMPYNAENGVFRYCTFSRVMEEKGITDANEEEAQEASAVNSITIARTRGKILFINFSFDQCYFNSFKRPTNSFASISPVPLTYLQVSTS